MVTNSILSGNENFQGNCKQQQSSNHESTHSTSNKDASTKEYFDTQISSSTDPTIKKIWT